MLETKPIFRALTFLALCFCLQSFQSKAHGQAPLPAQKSYRFINGRWFDGDRFSRRTFYSVDGILTRKSPTKIDETIDLADGYVVPPFAEAHSHKLDVKSEIEGQRRKFIEEGTMYVMVLTNHASNSALNRSLFNRPGALDVLYANGGITFTGQHPSFAYERNDSGIAEWWLPENMKIIQASRKAEEDAYWFTDSVEDVDKKWGSYLASKPDVVKIYLLDVKNNGAARKSISEKVAAHITKKAHAAGLRVAAHIESFEDLRIGLKLGVDVFAHLPHYNYDSYKPEPAQPDFTPGELKLIRKNKTVIIPTLSLNEEYSIVREASNNYQGRLDEKRFNRVLEFQKKTIANLRKAGFTFAIGSDRDSLTPELDYWARHNIFEPSFIFNTAAVTTPRVMYPQRKIGFLRTGYEASFLVLNGNPMTHFAQFKNIKLRFKQGRPI